MSETSINEPAPQDSLQPSLKLRLDEVSFDASWKKAAASKRLPRLDFAFRVIGPCRVCASDRLLDGILVRSTGQKTYFFVPDSGTILEMPSLETDRALFALRRGHHGGAGRAQGSRAKDGKVYTKRYTVTICPETVQTIVDKGEGEMSRGLRSVAALIRRRFKTTLGAVADLREVMKGVTNQTGKSDQIVMTSIYIDEASHSTLLALGGGNLSRGIRFAAWLIPRQLMLREQ